MSFLQFPHFPRIITVQKRYLDIILIAFIFFCVLINLVKETSVKSDLQKIYAEIMRDPTNKSLHEKIAEKYLYINKEEAEREFYLAEELYQGDLKNDGNVLGLETHPWRTWQNVSLEKTKLEQEIKYWSTVKLDFPTYKYAFMKLAVLNYEISDTQKANKYIALALYDSPGDKDILDIRGKFR